MWIYKAAFEAEHTPSMMMASGVSNKTAKGSLAPKGAIRCKCSNLPNV